MLKIYHAPATRAFRVIWVCEELAIPYEIVPVDFSPAYRASPEWRAMNPVGKVPVMTDGALKMFESGAMMQYVVDRYGAGRLQPSPDSPDHALYLQWCWFAEATFSRPLGEMTNHRREFSPPLENVLAEMARRASLSVAASIRPGRSALFIGRQRIRRRYQQRLCTARLPPLGERGPADPCPGVL